MDTANCPRLLSQILDEVFLVSKEKADATRKEITMDDFLSSIKEDTKFTTGSRGDGFNSFCSDEDLMHILNNIMVIYDYKQDMTEDIKTNTVLLVKAGNCTSGYVNLQIVSFGNVVDRTIFNSSVPIFDSHFLSSDIFREENLKLLKRDGVQCSSAGPSNKLETHIKAKLDNVVAFYCCHWPRDAYEWISRERIYGWPSKCMINNIVNMGFYIVPVGDKCSEDTLLQWRISFAAAERYLAQTLNNIQFQVYGLLKYTLLEIKHRIEHDTGEDDILCSYFMKTLIFYAVENSPQSLWQEKNIFVCFRLCLTMLIDWVQCGYCPNYFIKTNNMFKRKVHSGNKIKVLNILYELYDMKWQALSAGSAHRQSILKLLRNALVLNYETPTTKEYQRDRFFSVLVRNVPDVVIKSLRPFRKVMGMVANADLDTDEVLTYHRLAQLLVRFTMKLYKQHETNDGNKFTYIPRKNFKHWISFGTEKLYLATFYYQTGSYRKVIELCRGISSSITIKDVESYMGAFCGRGYPLYYKLNQAYSCVVSMKKDFLQFCPSDLHLEVCLHPIALHIPPKPYAMFLSFMSYHSMGHTKERDKELHDLLAIRYVGYEKKKLHWIVHTLVGICYQTKGDYCNAIRAYQDSLKSNSQRNPAMQRIKALQVFFGATMES